MVSMYFGPLLGSNGRVSQIMCISSFCLGFVGWAYHLVASIFGIEIGFDGWMYHSHICNWSSIGL